MIADVEKQELVEREVRRLWVFIRVLVVAMLALLAHALDDGLTTANAFSFVVPVFLLLAATGLLRKGRRLADDQRRSSERGASACGR